MINTIFDTKILNIKKEATNQLKEDSTREAASSNGAFGKRLTRKKSVRFSDGFAPGKEINDLNIFLTRHYLGNSKIYFLDFFFLQNITNDS